MNNIANIIEDRDDVAAAIFAAQLGADLKYVDRQTTNKPNQQPHANRLDPKKFLKSQHQFSQQPNPPPNLYESTNSDQIVPTKPLKDLIIPLPDGAQPIPQNNQIQKNGEQLELPLKINENKKPTTIAQWFLDIDKKIEDLDLKLTLEIQKINKSIRDLIIKMDTKKSRKTRVNQN